jgi:hypothetical protein
MKYTWELDSYQLVNPINLSTLLNLSPNQEQSTPCCIYYGTQWEKAR